MNRFLKRGTCALIALACVQAVSAADLTPGTYDEQDSNINFINKQGSDNFAGDGTQVGSLYNGTRSYSNNVAAEFVFTVKDSYKVQVTGQVASDHGSTLVTVTNLTDSTAVVTDASVSFAGPGDVRYNDYEVFSISTLDPAKRYEVKFHTFDGYAIFDKVAISGAYGLSFDGVDDRVTIPDSAAMRLATTNFSIAAWVKPSDLSNARADIISNGQYNSAWDTWTLYLNQDKFGVRTGPNADPEISGTVLEGTTSLAPNRWTHIAVTFDNGTLTTYVNGIQDAQTTGAVQPADRGSIIQIGGDSLPRYMFTGSIDEISIWNKTLTAAEVTGIKAETFTNDSGNVHGLVNDAQIESLIWADLIGYFSMDEGTGSTIADTSDNAATGTLLNSPAWVLTSTDLNSLTPVSSLTAEITEVTVKADKSSFTLTWGEVVGATTYEIEYDTVPTFDSGSSTVVTGLTGTSTEITADFTTVSYFARIRVIEDEVAGIWSTSHAAVVDKAPGNALSFSGNSWVDLGTTGFDFSGTNPFTIEMWVKPASANMTVPLFTKYNSGSSGQVKIYLTNGLVEMEREVNPWPKVTSTTALSADTWYHVAATYDGANMHLYIDGIKEAGDVASGSADNLGWGASLTAYLGRDTNSGNGYFTGEIDEVRVWSVARTGAEITADMSKEIIVSGDLVAYLRFDQFTAPTRAVTGTVQDLTGNGNNGTVEAATSVTSTSPLTPILTPAIGLEVVQTGTELTWSVAEEVGVYCYEIIVDGETTKVMYDVEANGSYSVTLKSDSPATLTVVDNSGFTQTFIPADGNIVKMAYDLTEGWNLIAMPGENADTTELNSAFWGWNGDAYELVETPKVGQAVWIYSPVAKQVIISAEKVEAELTLESGWNLVGPTENMEIPAEAHTVYGWNDTYQVIASEDGVLLQGVGYWIFSL